MNDDKMKKDARLVYSFMGVLTVVFFVVIGMAIF